MTWNEESHLETNTIQFEEFLTQELEQEVLTKLSFLKEMGFGEPASAKNLQKDIPNWTLIYGRGLIEVSVSISFYVTNITISLGEKYFPLRHYLTFIKSKEWADLEAEFFPRRSDIAARRKYCLDTLDLFVKHANLGLKSVLEEKVWLDVPYYWGIVK